MITNEGYKRLPGGLKPLYVRTWEPEQPAGLLVCVHGAGGNSADFSCLAESIAAPERPIRYRVVAFDAPGNGLSEDNANIPALTVKLQCIKTYLNRSPLPVQLLASSGGAIASLVALYQMSDHEALNRIPIILSEPSIAFDEGIRTYIDSCRPFLESTFLSLDEAEAAWDQSALGRILFEDRSSKRRYIRGRLIIGGGSMRPARDQRDPSQIKPFNVLHGKSKLPNPALVLWGDASGLENKFGDQIVDKLPNCETMVFAGAGHPLSLSRPAEIEAIAKFLDHHHDNRK